MWQVNITINGADKVIKGLGNVSDRLSGGFEPLRETKTYMLEQIQRNFASEGKLFGEQWAKLKQSTIRKKKKLGYPDKMLVRTYAMKRAFDGVIFGTGDTDSLVITNPTPYFAEHQLGSAKTKLPQRVMLKVDKRREEFILRIFTNWVNRNIEQSFT